MDENRWKLAITRRDPKFDGRFFFGVKTTGIYCRPVCPAKPKPENILLFKSPSEAESNGYRACKRCKPDLAPQSRLNDEKFRPVYRALQLMESDIEEISVKSIAEHLQTTTRNLRRLFQECLGASPIEIIATKRLHLAKQLLSETQLPVTEVAFASGFQSIRRFNEAFKKVYKTTPSSTRSMDLETSENTDYFELNILLRLPYDWQYVVGYLEQHKIWGSEEVCNGNYIRKVRVSNDKVATVKVSLSPQGDSLKVVLSQVPLVDLRSLLSRVRSVFDVEHNPSHLSAILENKALEGIRCPSAFHPFESSVQIILEHSNEPTSAQVLLKKLVEKFGTKIVDSGESATMIVFPSPTVLANANLVDCGIDPRQANAIQAVSQLVVDNVTLITPLSDIEKTKAQLGKISELNFETIEMIAMRCLSDSSAFPSAAQVRSRQRQALIDSGLGAYAYHLGLRE